MSKHPRWGGPNGVERTCAYCGHGMPEQKPVYLVRTESGLIVGPYHSGCAEKIKIEAERRGYVGEVKADRVFGEWPAAREETLPE